jgi:hypothetical protein
VVPDGVTGVLAELWGAGGGGGGGGRPGVGHAGGGGGGGSGAYVRSVVPVVPGTTYRVIVGPGGGGGAASGPGVWGGDTSLIEPTVLRGPVVLARAAGGRGGEPGSGDVTCASSLDEVLASGGVGGDGGPPPASLGTLRRAGVDGNEGLPAVQTLVFDSAGPRCIGVINAFGSAHGGVGVAGSLSPAGTAGGSGGAPNQAGGAGQPGYALIVW